MKYVRKYKVTSDVPYEVPDHHKRIVSPAQYDVLKQMAQEGKLTAALYLKDKYPEEYFTRVKDKRK